MPCNYLVACDSPPPQEVGSVMDHCPALLSLDLSLNPMTRLPKYRERIILLSYMLGELLCNSPRPNHLPTASLLFLIRIG